MRQATGLPVVTEVVDPADVDLVASYADMLQVGTRNMQNFPLLQAVGGVGKPVMLKRGMNATIEDFGLDAAHRRGDRFAFRFFRSGAVMVDGVLPVGGIDGSAVSLGPFDTQG